MKRNIAIFNNDEAILNGLSILLKNEGCVVSIALVNDFKKEVVDINKYFNKNQPRVVLWDIMYPYWNNFLYFKKVVPKFNKKCRFIIISTGKLEQFGDATVQNTLQKPFDNIDDVVKMVGEEYKKAVSVGNKMN